MRIFRVAALSMLKLACDSELRDGQNCKVADAASGKLQDTIAPFGNANRVQREIWHWARDVDQRHAKQAAGSGVDNEHRNPEEQPS
jgi:hypothetical protein